MGFINLPPEIVGEIAVHLSSRKDLLSFGHVNRQSYVILKRAIIHFQNFTGMTLLAEASKSGDKAAVASYLKEKPNVNISDSLGRAPLCWASGSGHEDVVLWLLQSGAEANKFDGFGRTALSWAAEKGHFDVVKLLIHHGAQVPIDHLPNIDKLENAARKSHPNSSQLCDIFSRSLVNRERRRYVLHKVLRHELCCIDPLLLAKKNGHEKTVDFLQSTFAQYSITTEPKLLSQVLLEQHSE